MRKILALVYFVYIYGMCYSQDLDEPNDYQVFMLGFDSPTDENSQNLTLNLEQYSIELQTLKDSLSSLLIQYRGQHFDTVDVAEIEEMQYMIQQCDRLIQTNQKLLNGNAVLSEKTKILPSKEKHNW